MVNPSLIVWPQPRYVQMSFKYSSLLLIPHLCRFCNIVLSKIHHFCSFKYLALRDFAASLRRQNRVNPRQTR
jgi:hypothetical protein